MKAQGMLSRLAAAFAGRLGSAVATFSLFWLLAHHLAPEELGVFAVLTSVFALLQLMPLLGLHLSLARDASLGHEQVAGVVHAHLWFAVPVTATLVVALAVYGAWAYDGRFALPFGLLALAMVPTGWTTVAEATLIGLERLPAVGLTNFAESVWRLVASLAVVSAGASLTAVMLVFLVGRWAAAVAYWRHARLPPVPWRRLPALGPWLSLWRSVPVFFGLLSLSALCSRIDVIALSLLVPIEEAGRYAAGAKFYEAALMIPSLATIVILPPLARLFERDRSAFVPALPQAMRLLLALGLPLAFFGAAFAPTVILAMFPARFVGTATVVQLLLFAAAFATIDLLLSAVMVASHAQREDLRTMTAGCTVLVLCLAVLVPSLGIAGAAVAVLLHMVARVAWRLRWAHREFSLDGLLAVTMGAALAVSCGMVALVFAGKHGAAAAACASAGACIVGAWIGRLVQPRDLHLARAFLSRRAAAGPV